MEINLKDNIPVQKSYQSIPRPLYSEVKAYIEDLLNQGLSQNLNLPIRPYPGSEPSGIREQDEGKERRLWATAYLTVFC